jgi:AraC-like DNA-binding protein
MQPFNPLLVNLPRVLKIGRRTDDTDRLDQLIEMTMTEMQSNSAGSIAMRLRFSELLFVELLQRYLQQPESGHYGWMSGLRDPVTSRALALLHSDTAKDWTLEVLVREAGASRSVLAERFQRLIGQGPIQYLTCWRMQLAAQMLLKADTKVSAIAFNVGYASVAAFSRAFKKVTGFSPSEWREREKSDAG